MRITVLPPLYLPPAAYFDALRKSDMAVIDTSLRYDKRYKGVHRTRLMTPSGAVFMTVPVCSAPGRGCGWDEVRVSGHGGWFKVQRMTLATLFGSTPYFDLYKTDLFPFISEDMVGVPVTDLDVNLLLAVMRLSDIKTPLSVSLDPRYETDSDVETIDLRRHDFYADGELSAVEKLFREGGV